MLARGSRVKLQARSPRPPLPPVRGEAPPAASLSPASGPAGRGSEKSSVQAQHGEPSARWKCRRCPQTPGSAAP